MRQEYVSPTQAYPSLTFFCPLSPYTELCFATQRTLQEWRLKAREVEEQANSRRGVVHAQAIIRGYLARSKSGARYLPDNLNPDEG